jgi:hypothetical protein
VAFVVLYDACVLYPAPVRDLLLRVATTGIVRARWSEAILDECFRNIAAQRPEIPPEALARTRALMNRAVPDCLVTGYEHLIEGLELPDPDDRHVLAAAIRAHAQAIVTFNLKDFPGHVLARYDMEPKHPDEFVLDSIDLAPGAVVQCVTAQAAALRSPPVLLPDLLDTLRRLGLVQSVARLRDLLGPLASGGEYGA